MIHHKTTLKMCNCRKDLKIVVRIDCFVKRESRLDLMTTD